MTIEERRRLRWRIAKMERRKGKMISHLDSYIDVDKGWKIYE